MAHFYGSMRGSRGEATRMGTKASGFTAHIRGWDIGARVEVGVNDLGQDIVIVHLTRGSNDVRNAHHCGVYRIGSDGNFERIDQ